jgi:hypothetical protein
MVVIKGRRPEDLDEDGEDTDADAEDVDDDSDDGAVSMATFAMATSEGTKVGSLLCF